MEKYLRITMPDGSKYDIPAKPIAEARARYYAKVDTGKESGKEFDSIFNLEVRIALYDDTYLIEDWASNNMNWEDLKDIAVKVSDIEVDYQDGWINGDKEVIEK